jgi:cobalt-zinc-cadmium efflux system outer membrane protein
MGTGHDAVYRQIDRLFRRGGAGGATDAQLLERFVNGGNLGAELAFETLIERHGAMVLRVCRSILRDPHDAQDAFQATFLVLARKAAVLAKRELLGNWLYGVAYRTAMKARAGIARRRSCERQAAMAMVEAVPGQPEPDDLPRVLHEEINRLPEGLRACIVLCYLEGMTYEMAARHLRITPSIVRGRLARARGLLRLRLIRRGLVVTSGVVLTAIQPQTAAAIPPGLVRSTAEGGLRYAAGNAVAGGISGSVAGLAEGVLTAMRMGWLNKAAAIALAIGIAGSGVGVIAQQDSDGAPCGEPAVQSGSNAPGEVGRSGRDGGEEKGKGGESRTPLAMTLDEAIVRLLREDHDLEVRFSEIPRARADVLSAALRTNPIFYSNGQLIPYGRYRRSRPGGQTEYDLNISYPSPTAHRWPPKRGVAARPERVLEAQYQDAVRTTIENLYIAYVDVLAARQTVRSAQQSVQELDRALTVARRWLENAKATRSDLNRVRIQQASAEVHLGDSEAQLRKATRTLAALLNLPDATADSLELKGSILEHAAPPPSADSLIAMALENRPDLGTCRLAVRSAEPDAPLTRNLQSRVSDLERAIVTEMQLACREYETSREAVRRVEHDLLPRAELILKDTWRLYDGGEISAVALLNTQRDYNDTLAVYHGTLVRRRRSMLALNTVVGMRIMP